MPVRRHEFDPARFARALRSGRLALGMSTRELAAAAGISQAYLVALESAGRPGARRPVPTVDVVAGLAAALGRPAGSLFGEALRECGHHVLMVVDGDGERPAALARRMCRDRSVEWVRALAPADRPGDAGWSICLDAGPVGTYLPDQVARSLQAELAARPGHLDAEHLGLLFERTATVMASADDPSVVLDFEDRWGDVVADAARASGAHVAWNVCVYELDRLAALADPVGAAVGLLRSHDTVWMSSASGGRAGADAARQLLLRLRPAGAGARTWRADVARILESNGLAA